MSVFMGADYNTAMSFDAAREKIDWARRHMPVLAGLREELETSRPFDGLLIGICLHVEPKTAVLCSVLRAGGAEVAITGSPGTTKDGVADALREQGIAVYGREKDDAIAHHANIEKVMSHQPRLLLDNGADLAAMAVERSLPVVGGTEETTTGANRLREEFAGKVGFPILVINDSPLKSIVENQHGVGQTIVEGFMRTTNLLIPRRRFVVVGYGWCGRGVARYLKSFGGDVSVVESDAIRALEAALDGFAVRELDDALPWGDVFITVTGRPGILRREHFDVMRDGAILANAGHFSWEIELGDLEPRPSGDGIERIELPNGKTLYRLARGEMLNLAGGGGNPIETMDLGLALQTMSLTRIAQGAEQLAPGPQPVPDDINREIARRMLAALSSFS
jgi:adenosylhomocysteinase